MILEGRFPHETRAERSDRIERIRRLTPEERDRLLGSACEAAAGLLADKIRAGLPVRRRTLPPDIAVLFQRALHGAPRTD